MIKINVNKREIELILLSYKTMGVEKNFTISEDENFVIIEDDDKNNLDLMLNYILDTFLEIGLKPDTEPNELGMGLIERINHEFVSRFGLVKSELSEEEKQS